MVDDWVGRVAGGSDDGARGRVGVAIEAAGVSGETRAWKLLAGVEKAGAGAGAGSGWGVLAWVTGGVWTGGRFTDGAGCTCGCDDTTKGECGC